VNGIRSKKRRYLITTTLSSWSTSLSVLICDFVLLSPTHTRITEIVLNNEVFCFCLEPLFFSRGTSWRIFREIFLFMKKISLSHSNFTSEYFVWERTRKSKGQKTVMWQNTLEDIEWKIKENRGKILIWFERVFLKAKKRSGHKRFQWDQNSISEPLQVKFRLLEACNLQKVRVNSLRVCIAENNDDTGRFYSTSCVKL
jgi:hypothetical protein